MEMNNFHAFIKLLYLLMYSFNLIREYTDLLYSNGKGIWGSWIELLG